MQTRHDRIVLVFVVPLRHGIMEGHRIEDRQIAGIAERFPPGCIGDKQNWRGIVEDVGETLARIGRIERHIGAARLEDRQQRDDQLVAAGQAQSHTAFGAHAQTHQMTGQAIGARIELRIGE
ncbi:hypothetical protein AWB78_08265 [Caballeronia calidae]|uniref:Uncharacterized protein n=1 Tax=Caballeronia calidae TaxID=1777139 RepID=A0A158EIV7_9BURK|nr:hypothetical protein AWB78_08265 [Caballeronia calidae]